MANVKISQLPSLSTMTDAGEIPVVDSGTTQQITGANLKNYFTANVGFVDNTIYDLNGLTITNSDLSHGATATISVPDNGNTASIQATNTYGNFSVSVGSGAAVTATMTFKNTGNLDGVGNLNATGLSLSGNIVSPVRTTGNITTTANISGQYILGNGSQLTGINVSTNSISNGNSNVQIPVANGNVNVTTAGTNTWAFDTDGALNLTNMGVVRNPNGSGQTNIVANDFAQLQWVDVGNINIPDPNNTGGPTNWMYVNINGAYVETNVNGVGNIHSWHFGNTGETSFPGNIVSSTDDLYLASAPGAANASLDLPQDTANYAAVLESAGNVQVIANSNTWNFYNNGTLSAPGNVTAPGLLVDTVTGITANAGNINVNQVTGLGGWLNAVGANISGNINAANVNVNDISIAGNVLSNIYIDGIVQTLGNLEVYGNIYGESLLIDTVAGITANAGNIDINQVTGLGGWLNAAGVSVTGNINAANVNGNVANLTNSGNTFSMGATGILSLGDAGGTYLTLDKFGITANTQMVLSAANASTGNNSSFIFDKNGGGISIRLENNVGPSQAFWSFYPGNLRFPDNSVQTTAYGNANATALLAALNSNVISSTGNITTTANISGGYILGNGSQLTGLGATYGNANVTTLLAALGANTISSTGNITTTANISGGNLLGTLVGSVAYGAGTVSGTGNITGGNITTGGTLSATTAVLGNTATVTTSNYAIGYRDIPQVSLGANANAALTDAGKHFYSTTAGNLAILIPTNANVAFPTGAAFTVVVQAAGNVLINADGGVTLYVAGNSTSGNRVVSSYGMATVMKVATDTWFINGTGVS